MIIHRCDVCHTDGKYPMQAVRVKGTQVDVCEECLAARLQPAPPPVGQYPSPIAVGVVPLRDHLGRTLEDLVSQAKADEINADQARVHQELQESCQHNLPHPRRIKATQPDLTGIAPEDQENIE